MTKLGAPHRTVTILTSGVGLGTYVPAVLNQRALLGQGADAELVVAEALYTPEHLQRQLDVVPLFRRNLALADLSQRAAGDMAARFSSAGTEALLSRWENEGRREFIVWSGQWLAVLRSYAERIPAAELHVDLCRIDAVVSPSFRSAGTVPGAEVHEIWLWSDASGSVEHTIAVGDEPMVPFAERDRRLVVHGGGWALSNYGDAAVELGGAGYPLDLVSPDGGPLHSCSHRRFRPVPGWTPWESSGQRPAAFPPLEQVHADGSETRCADGAHHALHGLVRRSWAIVSKPGGGTLIDSLASATPVVFLEPLGAAEAANARVWCRLGFGLTIADWRATWFSEGALAECHNRLVSAVRGRCYPQEHSFRAAAGASVEQPLLKVGP